MKSKKSKAIATSDAAAQAQQPKFKRDLPDASAQRPVLIRAIPIEGFYDCCRCGREGLVNAATDGHLYCRPCAGDLVEAGQAQVGGYATGAPHACQKESQA